jgi:hypothetical protein
MVRRFRFVVAAGLIAAVALTSASSALASGRKVFDSSMVGIPTGGLVLDGVTGGGVPWSIDEGRATLTADGRLHVEVEGLVVTASGTNPSPTGRAAVACDGAVVATTDAVPFSATGDAEIDATVSLPSPCLDVAVFFLNGAGTRWFAVTGI